MSAFQQPQHPRPEADERDGAVLTFATIVKKSGLSVRQSPSIHALKNEQPARDVEVRIDPRTGELRKLNWERPQNAEAALMQATGVEANPMCDKCKEGWGPFVGCITSAKGGSGACANCHYNSQGSRCQFRKEQDAEELEDGQVPAQNLERKAPELPNPGPALPKRSRMDGASVPAALNAHALHHSVAGPGPSTMASLLGHLPPPIPHTPPAVENPYAAIAANALVAVGNTNATHFGPFHRPGASAPSMAVTNGVNGPLARPEVIKIEDSGDEGENGQVSRAHSSTSATAVLNNRTVSAASLSTLALPFRPDPTGLAQQHQPAVPSFASAPSSAANRAPAHQIFINTSQSYFEKREMARVFRALADAYDQAADQEDRSRV